MVLQERAAPDAACFAAALGGPGITASVILIILVVQGDAGDDYRAWATARR